MKSSNACSLFCFCREILGYAKVILFALMSLYVTEGTLWRWYYAFVYCEEHIEILSEMMPRFLDSLDIKLRLIKVSTSCTVSHIVSSKSDHKIKLHCILCMILSTLVALFFSTDLVLFFIF